jgi:hypothetical protein
MSYLQYFFLLAYNGVQHILSYRFPLSFLELEVTEELVVHNVEALIIV